MKYIFMFDCLTTNTNEAHFRGSGGSFVKTFEI